MKKNSENPAKGRAFEKQVHDWAVVEFGCEFTEKAIAIGNPPSPHKYDLVSEDESVIIECKCYTWTEGNNTPSAKLSTANEAVFYLQKLSHPAKKILAIQYAKHPKKESTLAEYYCEHYGHLLDDVEVWEPDKDGIFHQIMKNKCTSS